MEYLALYRKYRPSGFEGVIGQEHIINTLTNQITNSRLGHAYLFTGTRGTGKTSVAKIFAKAINCLSPINGSPCGKCECCKALNDPSNIDVIEIDAASNNGVNEIRELRENVQFPPVNCKYKVYIIDEVHMLSGSAFNALLKTLEEPPKHAVFILATTEVHKIPATILSRCMRFDFRLVDTERIANLIDEIYKKEGKKFEKEAVFAIAKAGEGSVRDSLSIADMAMSITNDVLTYQDVMNALGITDTDILDDLVDAIISSNSSEVFSLVEKLTSLGKSVGILIKDITSLLRDMIVINTCKDANAILGLPIARFEKIKSLSNTDTQRLIRILEIFTELAGNLRYSNNPRIVFETAVLKATMPQTDCDVLALSSRIKQLEDKIESGNVSVETTTNEFAQIVEQKKEPKVVLKISDFSMQELKGKLLTGLRNIGSEMLWTIVQNVSLDVKGNVLTLNVASINDYEILYRTEAKNRIKQALCDFSDFELVVSQTKENVELKELDDATEKIKSIFGDDIVIIKD